MPSSHFDAATAGFTQAFGSRLNPGINTFPELFTEDGMIEVPFDGDGTAEPIRGRAAITAMVDTLDGTLRFEQLTVSRVYEVEPATVISEYEALLHRKDLDGHFRRRYISVLTMRDGRIQHARKYGGPFRPVA